VDHNRIQDLVRAICKKFGVDCATVSIGLFGNDKIIDINNEFLDRRGSTDVISFDLSSQRTKEKWFDIAVNAEKAREEAAKRGHWEMAEVALYVTHGMLHNFGFDDQKPEEAKRMHAAEDKILEQTGFGAVYNSGQ